MPKVSIIVPIYNVEEYLERCINSLIGQTLEDIQIILVNDGSTDKSGEIAKRYASKYKEKIMYLEKTNGGLSDARNYGLPYATGEYIAFLDSDDYIEKEAYQEMYEKAKEGQAPKPKTSHTLNPVPFIVYDPTAEHELKDGNFGLSNVAATVTQLLGVETPSMWDESMLKF